MRIRERAAKSVWYIVLGIALAAEAALIIRGGGLP